MSQRVLWTAMCLAFVFAWAEPMLAQLLTPGELARPHAHLSGDKQCGKCHVAGRRVGDHLCIACHTDIGKAIAAGRGLHGTVWKGRACPTCHSDHRGANFSLVRFDKKILVHDQTGFPLKGTHATLDCARCHKSKGKWTGVARACNACHQDAHGGRFGTACATCHEETRWSSVRLEKFDHNIARFPLRGGHGKVPCESCHGTPRKYRGVDFASCTSCHQDPHRGRFREACTSCHDESSWRSVRFTPSAHPRLSLANGHAGVACGKCHDRGSVTRPSRGSACVSCHKQVHEAPFGKTCETCHSSIRWLGLPDKIRFAAHDKAPFLLHGKHTTVPCDRCHSPKEPANKRFRQLEFDECKDCHADPHSGQFAKMSGGECGACHADTGFSPTTFGPAEHTAFPLVGGHLAVPCNSCHRSGLAQKQRLDWHDAASACADCHKNPHGDQFSSIMQQKGCGACHSPTAWDTPNVDHRVWPLTGAHGTAKCGRCHTATADDRKLGKGPSYRKAPRQCAACHTDAHAGQFRLTVPRRECNFCHDTSSFSIDTFDHVVKAAFALEGKHSEVPCDKCHAPERLRGGATAIRYRLGYRRCQDCHADPHSERPRR